MSKAKSGCGLKARRSYPDYRSAPSGLQDTGRRHRCLTSSRAECARENGIVLHPPPRSGGGGPRVSAVEGASHRSFVVGAEQASRPPPRPPRFARSPSPLSRAGCHALAYLPRLKKRSFWSSLAASRFDLIGRPWRAPLHRRPVGDRFEPARQVRIVLPLDALDIVIARPRESGDVGDRIVGAAEIGDCPSRFSITS